MPTALWLWDVTKLSCCAIVLQTTPIRQTAWNPQYPHLLAMICGNNNMVYFLERREKAEISVTPVSVPAGGK